MGKARRRVRRGAKPATSTPDPAKPVTADARVGASRFRLLLACLFLLALAVRIVHVVAIDATPEGELLLGDAARYSEWAEELAGGDWLGSEVFYQAPLYPYALGLLYRVSGPDPGMIRAAQALLGALACAFLALAARRWFGDAAGLIAGALLAVYAPAIFFVGLVQKTTLALALFTLVLWLLAVVTTTDGSPLRWALLGAALGATALVRENVLVLLVPVGAWLALSHVDARAKLGRASALVAGLALALAPVALRNHALGGAPSLTTSQLGTNLYIGNNPDADGSYRPLRAGRDDPRFEADDARALAEERSGRALTASEVSSFYVDEVVRYVIAEPWSWARLMTRKTLLTLNAAELADTEDLLTHAESSVSLRALAPLTHFGSLLPLAAVGWVLTVHRRRELWLLYGLLACYALGVVAFFVFARYRFPLVPLLAAFAAIGLVELVRAARGGATRRVVPAVVVAALVAVVANWPLLDESSMRGVTHFNYGVGFQEAEHYELAETHFHKALRFQPRLAEAHYRIGVLSARKGSTDLAVSSLERSVGLAPDFHAARNALGDLLLRKGDIDGAETQFREAVRLDRSDPQALNNLARIAFQRRDLVEAKSLYLRSLGLDDQNPQTHNNLGIVAAIEGELPRAVEYFRQAIALDPGYDEARDNLARALGGT